MDGVQIRKCLLDAHEILFSKSAADVNIACDQSSPVRDSGESSNQNELDLRLNQSAGQFAEVLHSVSPWRREGNRQTATHHHWPACVPMLFLPGCLRAARYLFHPPWHGHTQAALREWPQPPSIPPLWPRLASPSS